MTSAKEKVWLAEYYKCWNETEAARRADYKWPNKQGPRLAQKLADEIKAHIEQVQMDADEVLRRLAEQARAEYSQYLQSDGSIDLEKLISDGKAHLVKKTKWNKDNKLEVEFYDAHSALVDIGKHLGLFKEQIEGDIRVSGKLVILPTQDE